MANPPLQYSIPSAWLAVSQTTDGFPAVGHHLNRPVVVVTNQVIILLVGDFRAPQPVLLSPGLNNRDALRFTSSGGEDLNRHTRRQKALHHLNHLRDGLPQRIRRKEMSRGIIPGQSTVQIHTNPVVLCYKNGFGAGVQCDPGTELAILVSCFLDLQWAHRETLNSGHLKSITMLRRNPKHSANS